MIKISKDFQKLILERAKEIKKSGKESDVLGKEPFTKLIVFVGKKPDSILMELTFKDKEIENEIVYIKGM